ncbi:MAG: DinB family protein [Anaerolineales bacterium]|nr:DinB family protein [Anaerolineales bacterium]
MNRILTDYWPVFTEYQAMRGQMLAVLTDADLAFTPGGANLPLGALCREIGETEHIYVESFKTLATDWAYRHPDPSIAGSVARLTAWYAELDAELAAVIAAFSDEQLATQRVRRGPNFAPPIGIHLGIYQEALLIFYGKASVYLKALGKPLSDQLRGWIA